MKAASGIAARVEGHQVEGIQVTDHCGLSQDLELDHQQDEPLPPADREEAAFRSEGSQSGKSS